MYLFENIKQKLYETSLKTMKNSVTHGYKIDTILIYLNLISFILKKSILYILFYDIYLRIKMKSSNPLSPVSNLPLNSLIFSNSK